MGVRLVVLGPSILWNAQPILITLYWNDLASVFKASIGNILEPVSVLGENLCHCVTGVTRVGFQLRCADGAY